MERLTKRSRGYILSELCRKDPSSNPYVWESLERMKQETHPAIFIGVIVVVLALAVLFGVRTCSAKQRGNSTMHMPKGPGIPVAH